MRCPKCGNEQPDGGLDCLRCGIVFSRYRPPSGTAALSAPSTTPATPATPPRPATGARPAAPPAGSFPPPGAAPVGAAPNAEAAQGGGGWEPAVVGTAFGHVGRGEAARTPAWSGGEQLYGGPEVPGENVPRSRPGDREEEPRHELTGRLYEGPPAAGGEAAAIGMAIRPAPRSAPSGRAAGVGLGMGASPFTYAAVMGDTFRVFFANLLPFLLIAAAVVLPFAVAAALAAASGSPRALLALAFVGLIELVLAGPLLTGAITFGVAQELRHREASIGECMAKAIRSSLAILGVAFLQSLVVLGGLILCIVPGLIAGIVLSVAVPAALEERCGVVASLHRSADLTRGHRWQVAGVLVSFALLQYLTGLAATHLLGTGADVAAASARRLPSMAAGLVLTGLQATSVAVMYYRLRSATEGVDVAALPSIFD